MVRCAAMTVVRVKLVTMLPRRRPLGSTAVTVKQHPRNFYGYLLFVRCETVGVARAIPPRDPLPIVLSPSLRSCRRESPAICPLFTTRDCSDNHIEFHQNSRTFFSTRDRQTLSATRKVDDKRRTGNWNRNFEHLHTYLILDILVALVFGYSNFQYKVHTYTFTLC